MKSLMKITRNLAKFRMSDYVETQPAAPSFYIEHHVGLCPKDDFSEYIAGEDAFFFTETQNFFVFGVFDGVGSWSDHGIDPGLFSNALCKNCEMLLSQTEDEIQTPKYLLQRAYEMIMEDESVPGGSSTALINYVDKETGIMKTTSLGDCSYLVLRDHGNEIVTKSREQQHSFNAPFQLSKIPKSVKKSSFISDLPSAGLDFEVQITPGDYVVSATDGFFDNIYLEEVQKIFQSTTKLLGNRKADKLMEDAYFNMNNYEKVSPFGENEARHYGNDIITPGGKLDDITFILSQVRLIL